MQVVQKPSCVTYLTTAKSATFRLGGKLTRTTSRESTIPETMRNCATGDLLAFTTGDLHQAAEHFEDSLSFCRRTGCRPELAWTCSDYADTLLQRNGDGDRAKAVSLLDESLAISSELGMRPLMERVLSRREILRA